MTGIKLNLWILIESVQDTFVVIVYALTIQMGSASKEKSNFGLHINFISICKISFLFTNKTWGQITYKHTILAKTIQKWTCHFFILLFLTKNWKAWRWIPIGTILNKLNCPYIIFAYSKFFTYPDFHFIFENLYFFTLDWIWNQFVHF